ncbi:hypothetical protein [Mycobacterium sp. Aquia_213]|uniref:hypothetical protein n=1 Tax=Mycobacterium sp. Aquia_213 TaxID=2991728 RepID=UPI002270A6F5|nr:hypothetical protein [Mycobacterium sp. Aquia_213]WAC92221.1 hypothetical protein LMQ14_03150 [Mycobacterium sp. Aquia_213]
MNDVRTPGAALAEVPVGSFVRVDDLPGSRAAASCAVSRAHKAGYLVPIVKGLYFKGAKSRYGMTRPTAEQIAVQVLGTVGAGPVGVSAARTFGLTTQIPAEPAFSVAGPVPTVHGLKVSKRNNMRRRDLRWTEVALLELLRGDWEQTVDDGWNALVDAADDAVRNGRVRLEQVGDAVDGERSPAARTHFSHLVEDLRGRGVAA